MIDLHVFFFFLKISCACLIFTQLYFCWISRREMTQFLEYFILHVATVVKDCYEVSSPLDEKECQHSSSFYIYVYGKSKRGKRAYDKPLEFALYKCT